LAGPGVAAAGLGDADEEQREEADEHVRADALVEAVIDGAELDPALQVAEAALGLQQVLVGEGSVGGAQGPVGGLDQVLAVEPLLRGDPLAVDDESATTSPRRSRWPLMTAGR